MEEYFDISNTNSTQISENPLMAENEAKKMINNYKKTICKFILITFILYLIKEYL